MHSEIFDNYARIALEKGIIKKGEETNPRYDSKSLSTIEVMYGIKPDKDILDLAHPDPIFVSPAHDKVNGLVENLKERQRIMTQIALRNPDGRLTQHIYVHAKKELLDEVIKIAFEMDKKDEHELMALADSCAEGLTKEAWTWQDVHALSGLISAPAAGYLATLLGATGPVGWAVGAGFVVVMALINNIGDFISQGLIQNCDRAMSRLQDVIRNNEEETNKIAGQITTWIAEIGKIKESAESFRDQAIKLSSMEYSEGFETSPELTNVKKLLNDYSNNSREVIAKIPSWVALLESVGEEGGSFDSTVWQAAKGIWNVLTPPEPKRAAIALGTLKDSLAESSQKMTELMNAAVKAIESKKQSMPQTRPDAQPDSELGAELGAVEGDLI